MTDDLRPVKWEVQPASPEHHRRVYVEEREQRSGRRLYAVTCLGDVLRSDGRWEYEPIPSNRTDAVVRRTRFKTLDDVRAALAKAEDRFAPRPLTTAP